MSHLLKEAEDYGNCKVMTIYVTTYHMSPGIKMSF